MASNFKSNLKSSKAGKDHLKMKREDENGR